MRRLLFTFVAVATCALPLLRFSHNREQPRPRGNTLASVLRCSRPRWVCLRERDMKPVSPPTKNGRVAIFDHRGLVSRLIGPSPIVTPHCGRHLLCSVLKDGSWCRSLSSRTLLGTAMCSHGHAHERVRVSKDGDANHGVCARCRLSAGEHSLLSERTGRANVASFDLYKHCTASDRTACFAYIRGFSDGNRFLLCDQPMAAISSTAHAACVPNREPIASAGRGLRANRARNTAKPAKRRISRRIRRRSRHRRHPGAWDPVTFTSSTGNITIDPYDDGDGVASTMAGHITARLNYTGEVVRFDVRIRNEIGSSTTTLLGSQVTGLTATTQMSLDGPNHNQVPISRNSIGWFVPPGTTGTQGCIVACGNFVSGQFNLLQCQRRTSLYDGAARLA
jgi:hypothetical protein